MVEQTDKSELSASSRIQPSDEGENNEQHKYLLGRQDQHLRTSVIDVFGRDKDNQNAKVIINRNHDTVIEIGNESFHLRYL
jgi:hypothetical protein